jgi:hypothetical protein
MDSMFKAISFSAYASSLTRNLSLFTSKGLWL